MIYVLMGPVGSGKSLMSTQRLRDYAEQGRRVAANYHVDFAPVALRRRSALSAASVTVLSSTVTVEELEMLGKGGPSEDRSGLLVLDEASTFLNARTWNEDGRERFLKWMRLSRKRKWDVVLSVQVLSSLDKQLRDGLIEIVGRIRRTDRIKIPLTGISLPRMHIANMRYGTNPQDVVIERWWSRGEDVFQCYDTAALFEDSDGPYSVLPATHSTWRHKPLTLPEKVIDIFKPYPANCYQASRIAPRPKAKHPLVELLAKLPQDEAVKHWHRLNSLGAFDRPGASLLPA